MSTCFHEIIKGAQLDPGCSTGSWFGKLSRWYPSGTPWLPLWAGGFLTCRIQWSTPLTIYSLWFLLLTIVSSWCTCTSCGSPALLSTGCQCRSFQRLWSYWYWSFRSVWPYYCNQYLYIGRHWGSYLYLTLHRSSCSHPHGPVIHLLLHRGREPLHITFLINREASLPPCRSYIRKVTAWKWSLKIPVLVWGIAINITC